MFTLLRETSYISVVSILGDAVWISGMPNPPYLYANDLNDVLKKKHASGTYKSLVSELITIICYSLCPYFFRKRINALHLCNGELVMQVFYLEACESGSIFEGLLPEGLNIYATTASNAEESSWGTYCPGEYPSPPQNMKLA